MDNQGSGRGRVSHRQPDANISGLLPTNYSAAYGMSNQQRQPFEDYAGAWSGGCLSEYGLTNQLSPSGVSANQQQCVEAYETNQHWSGVYYVPAYELTDQLPYGAIPPQPDEYFGQAYGRTNQLSPGLNRMPPALDPAAAAAAAAFDTMSLHNPRSDSTYPPMMHNVQMYPPFAPSGTSHDAGFNRIQHQFTMSTVPYQHGTEQASVHFSPQSSLGHQRSQYTNCSNASGVAQPARNISNASGVAQSATRNISNASATHHGTGTGQALFNFNSQSLLGHQPVQYSNCSNASGVAHAATHHEQKSLTDHSDIPKISTTASPIPKKASDISYADYVSQHQSNFTKQFDLFIKMQVLIATDFGAGTVNKLYRYVINTYMTGKSWGGQFEDEDLKMRSGKEFFIDKEPRLAANVENLMLDLKKITVPAIKSLKVDECTAIYAAHLEFTFDNPPSSIFQSEDALNIFLDFIVHHPLFAFSTPRGNLISAFGKLFDYAGSNDRRKIRDCLYYAGRTLVKSPAEWWLEVRNFPILEDVYWDNLPMKVRTGDNGNPNQKENTCGLFKYCRHSIIHAPEKSLVTVAAFTAGGQGTIQNAGPAQQASTTAVSSQMTAHSAPSGVQGSTIVGAQRNMGTSPRLSQTMPSPVHLEYMIGMKFDIFIADSICRILLETRLQLVQFVKEQWTTYLRSGFCHDQQRQSN